MVPWLNSAICYYGATPKVSFKGITCNTPIIPKAPSGIIGLILLFYASKTIKGEIIDPL